MSISRSTSILAVDFGNVNTRAILIDLVDGVYTLVAQAQEQTTAGFPHGDVGVGFVRVLTQLSVSTGRRLISPDGRVISPEETDRTGVDLFLATASIGRPLRTILLGLVGEMSIASGKRAAAGTYVDIVETINLGENRSLEDQLNAITLARPDLIFITGGTEGGAEGPVLELVQMARTAIRLLPKNVKPIVLYAGNSAVIPQIHELFDTQTGLLIADNVRPTPEREALESAQKALAQAYNNFTEKRGLGFDVIAEMSAIGVVPTAQSYQTIIDYLGRTTRGGVLAVDVGSAVSTVSASVKRFTATSIRTDIGLGHSANNILYGVSLPSVRDWLPFAATDAEITAYAMNKALRPASVPETVRELYLEHALLRAALRTLVRDARPTWTPDSAPDKADAPLPYFERIIGAGAALTGTGQPLLTAMLLLDSFQPVGVTRLQADRHALIPALGALAYIIPEAVVQVLDGRNLEDLGICISLSGNPRKGRAACRVRVTDERGEVSTYNVMGGTIFSIPLPLGVAANVQVSASGGVSINGKRRLKIDVIGGTAGVIIDARGRVLPLERSPRGLAGQLPAWYEQATGVKHDIPDDWLAAPEAPKAEAQAQKRQERRKKRQTATEDEPIFSVTGDPKAEPKKRGRPRKATQAEAPAPTPKEEEVDDLRDLLS
ncbi:MAG: glutamate mutase L [Anaerolineae bacterium]|uniref:glutamate mutase L n=1 Tax=Candidatus Flexifilum breve TaxID=3140694 RepID=UPI001AC63EDA|nr:glutamate mutase L [Chloroflexota bacterium]MBN8634049.1 glutamate mutase L [Anaerolineae bacterium]